MREGHCELASEYSSCREIFTLWKRGSSSFELGCSDDLPVMRMGERGYWSRRTLAGPFLPTLSEEVMPPDPVWDIRIGASYDMMPCATVAVERAQAPEQRAEEDKAQSLSGRRKEGRSGGVCGCKPNGPLGLCDAACPYLLARTTLARSLRSRASSMSGMYGSCCEEQEAKEAAFRAKIRAATKVSESRMPQMRALKVREDMRRALRHATACSDECCAGCGSCDEDEDASTEEYGS